MQRAHAQHLWRHNTYPEQESDLAGKVPKRRTRKNHEKTSCRTTEHKDKKNGVTLILKTTTAGVVELRPQAQHVEDQMVVQRERARTRTVYRPREYRREKRGAGSLRYRTHGHRKPVHRRSSRRVHGVVCCQRRVDKNLASVGLLSRQTG